MVSREADILQMPSAPRSMVLAQKIPFSVCLSEVNFRLESDND